MKVMKLATMGLMVLATSSAMAATSGSDLTIAPVLGASSFKLSGSDLDSRGGVLVGADVLIKTGIEVFLSKRV